MVIPIDNNNFNNNFHGFASSPMIDIVYLPLFIRNYKIHSTVEIISGGSCTRDSVPASLSKS